MSESRAPLEFPRIGINTQELITEVECLLKMARDSGDEMGAVNWGDLGVADIEYRLSILHPDEGACCVVLIEEASPNSGLAQWLNERLDKSRFPNAYIECEW